MFIRGDEKLALFVLFFLNIFAEYFQCQEDRKKKKLQKIKKKLRIALDKCENRGYIR